MRNAWQSAALVGALLMLGGCAGHMGGGAVAPAPAPPGTVTLAVTNHNWSPVTIYAVDPVTAHNLGTIQPSATEDFTLPPTAIKGSGSFRLFLSPLGSSDTYFSHVIDVKKGATVVVTIQPDVSLTTWRIA